MLPPPSPAFHAPALPSAHPLRRVALATPARRAAAAAPPYALRRVVRAASTNTPRPLRPFSSSPPPPPSTAASPPPQQQRQHAAAAALAPVLRVVRHAARFSALSASLLVAAALPASASAISPRAVAARHSPAPAEQSTSRSRSRAPAAAASPAPTAPAPPGATNVSDVEAAALTLAAVTLGGLAMRAVIHSRSDPAKEAARLKHECDRLAEEERQRALRADRRRMEHVDDDDDAPRAGSGAGGNGQHDAVDLMSELRKRVASLDESGDLDVDADAELDDASAKTKKDSMRQSPIPDRGTGSALLERPDGDGENGGPDGDGDDVTEGPDLPKPDDLEMLNRMWNLSPPDKTD